jgi:hypothetical protein
MKINYSIKRLQLAVLATAAVVLLGLTNASAANPGTIDIKVSIAATKSLSIGTTNFNYGTLGIGVSSVSATAIVVTNDSGGYIESYTLQGANADIVGGGDVWNLAASTSSASDDYALAAQFSTARPNDVDGDWNADSLTTSAQNCMDHDTFGNTTVGQSCFEVSPLSGSHNRNLWFRIKTPGAVLNLSQHQTTVTLGVQ